MICSVGIQNNSRPLQSSISHFMICVVLGLTSMEPTIISAHGSEFFIVVTALAAIFFKKYSKSCKKCFCYFWFRCLQLFRSLIVWLTDPTLL